MSSDIRLIIHMPEHIVIDEMVYRVVLPFDNKTLTVIKGRAPTLLSLDMGIIKILDTNNKTIREFVVSGGMADIKNDTCTVLTEAAEDKNNLTYEKVCALYEEYHNPFLKWLKDLLEKENKI